MGVGRRVPIKIDFLCDFACGTLYDRLLWSLYLSKPHTGLITPFALVLLEILGIFLSIQFKFLVEKPLPVFWTKEQLIKSDKSNPLF